MPAYRYETVLIHNRRWIDQKTIWMLKGTVPAYLADLIFMSEYDGNEALYEAKQVLEHGESAVSDWLWNAWNKFCLTGDREVDPKPQIRGFPSAL